MADSEVIKSKVKTKAVKSKTVKAQVKTEQVKTEQVKTEQVKTEQVKTEQVKTEQVKTEQVKTEQVKTEQVKKEQVKTEQVKTQVNTEEQVASKAQVNTAQVKTAQQDKTPQKEEVKEDDKILKSIAIWYPLHKKIYEAMFDIIENTGIELPRYSPTTASDELILITALLNSINHYTKIGWENDDQPDPALKKKLDLKVIHAWWRLVHNNLNDTPAIDSMSESDSEAYDWNRLSAIIVKFYLARTVKEVLDLTSSI